MTAIPTAGADLRFPPFEGICECCGKKKIVRMYVLQNGEAAFVCADCRSGKKP